MLYCLTLYFDSSPKAKICSGKRVIVSRREYITRSSECIFSSTVCLINMYYVTA